MESSSAQVPSHSTPPSTVPSMSQFGTSTRGLNGKTIHSYSRSGGIYKAEEHFLSQHQTPQIRSCIAKRACRVSHSSDNPLRPIIYYSSACSHYLYVSRLASHYQSYHGLRHALCPWVNLRIVAKMLICVWSGVARSVHQSQMYTAMMPCSRPSPPTEHSIPSS